MERSGQIVVDQNGRTLKEKELEDLRFTAHATSRELKTIKDRYEASLADAAAQTQAGVPTLPG
jgi:hypothetical protein